MKSDFFSSRACNFETKDMLAFKNRTGKLVIVCDYDETVASKFCTTLVERGYDNVFMLSGGSFANLKNI